MANVTLRSRNNGFDMLKAVCAFLVICIHSPFPGGFGAYFMALARAAVPVFFMISGYFYRPEENSSRQIRKVFLLFLGANGLFFVWQLLTAALSHDSIPGFLAGIFSVKSLGKFLLLNESPLGSHLWYLGAVLYVLVIMKLTGSEKIRIWWALTPLLLLTDLVLGKYSLLLLNREFPYVLVRNFLFVGIPYFSIGMMIRSFRLSLPGSRAAALAAAFALTTLLERFLLVHFELNTVRDHYISTTFLAAALFLFFRDATWNAGFLGKIGRKYASWIYIIHPIFVTIFRSAAKAAGIAGVYAWVAPFVIYAASVLAAAAAVKLWERGRIGEKV